MQSLVQLINRLEHNIQYAAVVNAAISKSPVGWHIDHALLTANQVMGAIEKSNPAQFKSKFSLAKHLVFAFNKFPRGRIEAPKSVRPAENFTHEDIQAHLGLCYIYIEKLNHFQPANFFQHPYFGHLNVAQSVRFLQIHTMHHLRIIEDILKASKVVK